MTAKTINCTYGRGTKSKCFVYEGRTSSYYVVKGGTIVNRTYETLEDGVDVEGVEDFDCFTWNKPINTELQLVKAVES